MYNLSFGNWALFSEDLDLLVIDLSLLFEAEDASYKLHVVKMR